MKKNILKPCGMRQTHNTKAGAVNAIADKMLSFVKNDYSSIGGHYNSIISVDIGIKNIGIAKMDSKGDRVEYVNLFSLDLELLNMDGKEWSNALKSLEEIIVGIVDGNSRRPSVSMRHTILLIEQQSVFRNGHRAQLSIFRCNLIEIMLHYAFENRCAGVFSISPQLVALKYYGKDDEDGDEQQGAIGEGERYKKKKSASVNLVGTMIEKEQIVLSEQAKAIWAEKGRKHDMADSIVQGKAFAEWEQATKDLCLSYGLLKTEE